MVNRIRCSNISSDLSEWDTDKRADKEMLSVGYLASLADRSDDDVRNYEQQREGAVYANRIAGCVIETESMINKRCNEMNEQVRKTKSVASDHPVSVPDDSFLFDLDERHYRDHRPYDI